VVPRSHSEIELLPILFDFVVYTDVVNSSNNPATNLDQKLEANPGETPVLHAILQGETSTPPELDPPATSAPAVSAPATIEPTTPAAGSASASAGWSPVTTSTTGIPPCASHVPVSETGTTWHDATGSGSRVSNVAPDGDARHAATRPTAPDLSAADPLAAVTDGSTVAGGSSASSSFVIPPTPALQEQPSRPHTRAQAGVHKPKQYTDRTFRYGMTAVAKRTSVQDAFLDDKTQKQAMDVEYEPLMKYNTWHLVPPNYGHNIIDCKRVFKIKKKADGTLDKYKARLVAKGYK
jgi:hypothetical protein